MLMNKIKWIFFDLGSTLVDESAWAAVFKELLHTFLTQKRSFYTDT